MDSSHTPLNILASLAQFPVGADALEKLIGQLHLDDEAPALRAHGACLHPLFTDHLDCEPLCRH